MDDLATPRQPDGAPAQTFRRVTIGTLVIATGFLTTLLLVQPELLSRCLLSIIIVIAICTSALLLNRLGYVRPASWLLIVGLVALVTANALKAGGVRSPGAGVLLVFVLMAGVLLDRRACFIMAGVCCIVLLGLAVAEVLGHLPQQTVRYGPIGLWMLASMYIGIVIVLTRMTTSSIERALERARTESAERRQAEQKMALALESGGIGVFDQDLATQDFRGDARALAIFGLTSAPQGVVALQTWINMVHPDDRPRALEVLGGLHAGSERGCCEYRITRPDGMSRHIMAQAMPVSRGTEKPERIVGIVEDITERKVALLEREKLIQDLGERVKELSLLHATARLLQQDGLGVETVLSELAGLIPPAWKYPECCEARIAYRDFVAATPGWRDSQWRLQESFATSAGTGTIEVVYLEARPPAAAGPFLAEECSLLKSISEMLAGYIERDLGMARKREAERQLQQAQKMEALGTLAGGIAHDFNNILTVIIGNVMLGRVKLAKDEQACAVLDKIGHAGDRAKDLVKRILLFSRRHEVKYEEVQLPPAVADAGKLLRSSLPQMVKLRTNFAPDLPSVIADPVQVHQVIMNLGINAGHAMKQHGGELLIEVDQATIAAAQSDLQLKPGAYVRITVRDTGSGMTSEVLSRLFEPFFTTKGDEGTGLGLSVVHGIVKDHGGAITVKSELGKGTEFQVYFPTTQPDARAKPQTRQEVVRGNNEHIMYVDDESELVPVMVRMLEMLGYKCTGFADAHEALRTFNADPFGFDAVVTDYDMPAMTGTTLARGMRAIRPDVPVALITGSMSENSDDINKADFFAKLPKPATLEQLSLALQFVFQGKPPRV